MTSADPPRSPHDPVEDLLVACLEQQARPPAEELERLCEAHPASSAELRQRFALVERLGMLRTALGDPLPRLGDFTLLQKLGEGGFGTVHLARQESLGRRVALKLLRPGLADAHEARRRLRQEAEFAARLEHANICPLLEAGEVEGVPYLAMRYIPGETLDLRIARARLDGAAIPADRVLGWTEQVARALHAAHRAGLIHRDVKPGNVLIDHEGHAFLLDFGLARLVEDERGITRSGQVVGTPAYLAPEQLEPGGEVRPATDIYGLGVLLYELLTLHVPFEARTREALYRQILTSRFVDPRGFNRRISRDTRNVVAKAMDRNPDRRYATAEELADDLRRARAGETVRARPVPVLLRLGRWIGRNRMAAAGLVVTFVALLLSLTLLNQERWRKQSDRARYLASASDQARTENETSLAALLALESEALRPDDVTLGAARLNALLPDLLEVAQFDLTGPPGWTLASPDGRDVLSASRDGSVRLLDAADLRELWSTKLPWAPWAMAFDGTGHRFLAGRAWSRSPTPGSLQVWERTGDTVRPLALLSPASAPGEGPAPFCRAAAFRPDGSIVAAFGTEVKGSESSVRTQVCLFDGPEHSDGRRRSMPRSIAATVWDVDVSQRGTVLLACDDGSVYAWIPESDHVEVFDGLPASTFFARWLDEEHFVASTGIRGPFGTNWVSSDDCSLRLHHLGAREPVAVSPSLGRVISWLDVNGRAVVVACDDRLSLWSAPLSAAESAPSGSGLRWQLQWERPLGSRVWFARFSTDGARILSGTEDGCAHIHDLDGRRLLRAPVFTREVTDVVDLAGGARFAASSWSQDSIRLLSARSALRRFTTEPDLKSLVPDPEGDEFLAVGSRTLLVLDAAGTTTADFQLSTAGTSTSQALQVVQSELGTYAVVQSRDRLELFAKRDRRWELVHAEGPFDDGVQQFVHADRRGVISPRRGLHFVDWQGRASRGPLTLPPIDSGESDVFAVSCSANGTIAATVGRADTARVYIVAPNGDDVDVLPFDPGGLTVLRFVGDTHLLVGAPTGRSLWNISERRRIQDYPVFRSSGGPAFDFWQDPNPSSSMPDARVLWRVPEGVDVHDVWSGARLARLRIDGVRSARFTADGRRVWTCTKDGDAREWFVDQGELVEAVRSQLSRHDFTEAERERYDLDPPAGTGGSGKAPR